MEEKEHLERQALAFILRLYNRREGTKWRLHVKRERPDFEIKDRFSGELMGVEVAHIFHDKKEAMMMLGRDQSHIHGIISADDHVRVLERVLKIKAQKFWGYDFDGPIILVLRDFSKIFDARVIYDERLHFKMPPCKYAAVYYLTRSRPDRKWDKLIRLK